LVLAPLGHCACGASHEYAISAEQLELRTDGHLDIDAVRPGAIVLAPVKVPGAGTYFGDMHALQSDGEIERDESRRDTFKLQYDNIKSHHEIRSIPEDLCSRLVNLYENGLSRPDHQGHSAGDHQSASQSPAQSRLTRLRSAMQNRFHQLGKKLGGGR
jgi:hypothetical protein